MTAAINANRVDPSAAHPTPVVHYRNEYQAPYNSSIVIVALVAFLSPLASFLWSLHNVATTTNPNNFEGGDDIDYYHNHDSSDPYGHHRHLQANNCNDTITYTTNNNDLSSTWAAIKYTTIISSVVGLLCLFGYESFRRDPIVGKYVYDRKRLKQPERTPPPFMLSRSLWRGHHHNHDDDDDDEENDNVQHQQHPKSSSSRWWCFKVPPAILEIVFLNLDSNYIRYSRAAHEARMERERMGYMACCMTGCFHNNCCSSHVSPSYAHDNGSKSRRRRQLLMLGNEGEGDGDFFVDADGYAFYPGYNFEYSHVYQDTTGYADDGDMEEQPKSGSSQLSLKKNPYATSIEFHQPKPNWNKNIDDLFPEDRRAALETARINNEGRMHLSVQSSLRSSDVEGGVVGGHNVVSTPPAGSFQFLRYAKGKEAEEESRGATATSELSIGPFKKSDLTGGDYELSNTDAKISGGSSVERNEMEDELFYSTSETLVGPIKSMKSVEFGVQDDDNVEADLRSPLLPESSAKSSNTTAGETQVGKDDNKESAADSETEPEYPSRLKYILLPPGFHCWTTVLQFLGYFFYLPAFFRLCHKIPTPSLKLPTVGGKSKGGDNDSSRTNTIPIENPGMELTEGEEELLRCAGLDTYLLVRLARFGFDVTFYPCCFSFVAILPIYHSCVAQDNQTLNGYVNRTIIVVPSGDIRMIWIVIFTCLLYVFIMRRLWFEWEVFIQLRHKFLASGDPSFHKSPTYLRTYRNTCMVESVPQELRSDRKLKDVFESLFPGQIERAEMVINTSDLEKVLKKRQKLIGKYDSLSARYMYESWRYDTWQRDGKNVGICTNHVSKPMEPKVRSGGLFSKRVNAFAFYNEKIKEIDIEAGEEYDILVDHRNKSKEASIRLPEGGEEDTRAVGYNVNDVAPLLVPGRVRQFFAKESPVFNGTGMVEFKSIVAKQSAVQCNLSGQPYYMITSDVPDPRDLLWFNVGVDRYTLETRKILVQIVLLLGLFGWGAIVAFITNLTNNTVGGMQTDYFLYPLIKDYLPALAVSLVLLWLPAIFFMLAMHVIRFKSHSRCDEFVLVWNTAYRLTNVFLTLFSLSYLEAFTCFKEKPEDFVKSLADKVVRQSTVLMNLVILAAGQETMLQLLQWRSLIKQAVLRPLINLNTRSKRYIDSLNTAPALEQSFLFGFFAPVLSYGLVIAMIYAFMAPLMLAICATFFYIATKVHTHNALFVYCQRCEGGGKLFYYWNRIVFITLYSSIVVFFAILTLKQYIAMGTAFLIIMTLVTYCFDKSVTNTFVVNSLYLPISIARDSDAKEDVLIAHSNIEREGGENFMYRNPLLNQENWNSKI